MRSVIAGAVLAAAVSGSVALGGACEPSWDVTMGQPGANADIRGMLWVESGPLAGIYVGGGFSQIGGQERSFIARWDGDSWEDLGGANGPVIEFIYFDDGSGPAVYACGSFTFIGETPALRIAKWDGSAWAPLGAGLDGPAAALAVYDDGSGPALHVGGSFINAGGSSARRVARWKDGQWSALGLGLTGAGAEVGAMAVHDDGGGPALFVAGVFPFAGGQPAVNVARWRNGAWSPLADGVDGRVYTLRSFDDGGGPALVAGGEFGASGSTTLGRIGRWANGAWTSLAGGIVQSGTVVRETMPFDDGAGPGLVATGNFQTIGGTSAARISMWRGGQWSPLGAGLGATGVCLAVGDDGATLAVGGQFQQAGGQAASSIAAWRGCAATGRLGDLNGDGFVNSSDLAALLGGWGGTGPLGDLNEDGLVNASDLAILLGAWG